MRTLKDALAIIQQIAPIAKRHSFDVALYGSVLTKGEGEDLDLFFIDSEVKTDDIEKTALRQAA